MTKKNSPAKRDPAPREKLKTQNSKPKKERGKAPDGKPATLRALKDAPTKVGATEGTEKPSKLPRKPRSSKSSRVPKSPKTRPEPVEGSPQTMEELIELYGEKVKGFKKGEEIDAKITAITAKSMYFDINGKTEGVVLGREFEACKGFIQTLKVGSKLKVRVGNPENDRGQILLNLRQAARDYAWEFFEDKLKKQEAMTVRGKEVNKGGLIVMVPYGLQGFVPGSQLGSKWQGKHQTLVNRVVKAIVIEVDRKNNRLVLSERLVSDADKIAAEEELLKKVKIGKSYEGKIVQVLPYGLMVEIAITEPQRSTQKRGKEKPANARLTSPSGEAISGQAEARKGLKRGDSVSSADSSALSAIPGLVHISEISWGRVEDIKSLYQTGDKIKVKTLRVEEGKLQLSVKQLASDPWGDLKKRYPQGEPIKGVVKRLEAYGALVEIEPGIEGLLHISKIPPDYQINVGDKVSCFVELANPKERKLSLGLVLKKKPVGYK